MGILTIPLVLPSRFENPIIVKQQIHFPPLKHPTEKLRKHQSIVPMARLLGPATFDPSKLKVLFVGVDEEKHPGKLSRTYTLTHCDITSQLTLAISQTINSCQLQGWYNKFQRDEVIAEWKKVKGIMSLHVHCHISGGHFLLALLPRLRYYIFCNELPLVMKAFVHGDRNLLKNYPDLREALVWVYFHSNISEFNKVECWGPIKDTSSPTKGINRRINRRKRMENKVDVGTVRDSWDMPRPCRDPCSCCFPSTSSIIWSENCTSDDKTGAPLKPLQKP